MRREILLIGIGAINVRGVAGARHTAVADFVVGEGGGGCGVADEHAEAGAEGGDGGDGGGYVGGVVADDGDVVDCDAAFAFEAVGDELGDAVEGAVTGAEVEDRGPVVAEVFGEGAGCAGGEGGEVVGGMGHVWLEGVAADDLVEVGGGDGGWGDEGVEAVDDELGALEAEHGGEGGLGGCQREEGEKGEDQGEEGREVHGGWLGRGEMVMERVVMTMG